MRQRVAIYIFPEQTLGSVIARAKENISGKALGRNLVIVAGGLNDALNIQAGYTAQRFAKGVEDLRPVSSRLQLPV